MSLAAATSDATETWGTALGSAESPERGSPPDAGSGGSIARPAPLVAALFLAVSAPGRGAAESTAAAATAALCGCAAESVSMAGVGSGDGHRSDVDRPYAA